MRFSAVLFLMIVCQGRLYRRRQHSPFRCMVFFSRFTVRSNVLLPAPACADDAEYISLLTSKETFVRHDRGFFCIKSKWIPFSNLIIIIENSVRQGGYPSYRLYTYLPCFFLSHEVSQKSLENIFFCHKSLFQILLDSTTFWYLIVTGCVQDLVRTAVNNNKISKVVESKEFEKVIYDKKNVFKDFAILNGLKEKTW